MIQISATTIPDLKNEALVRPAIRVGTQLYVKDQTFRKQGEALSMATDFLEHLRRGVVRTCKRNEYHNGN